MEKVHCSECRHYSSSQWLDGGLLPFCVSNAKCHSEENKRDDGSLVSYPEGRNLHNDCEWYGKNKWWRFW